MENERQIFNCKKFFKKKVKKYLTFIFSYANIIFDKAKTKVI